MTQGPEPDDPWGARPARPAPPTVPATAVPVVAPVDATLPPSEPETLTPVLFTGERDAWLRLLARGLALYLPTFGFYRFWLRTDQRRFLWRSIAVGGEVLEYHGTARELVVGFLFAIAIYLPITIAYTILGLYAETIQAFASIPFALFTFLFGYYASYRARRYRLTRTVFRGVRFWMDGSAWRFAFTAIGWSLLSVLTLGLAWPWMAARIERFKWGHSYYGDLEGAFDGRGWQLFKALFWPALGLVVGSVIPAVNLFAIPAMISVIMVVYARWLVGGISFGPVRLRSSIHGFALVIPALLTLLAVGLFATVWIGLGYGAFWGFLGQLDASGFGEGSDREALALLMRQMPKLILVFAWGVVGLIGFMFLKSVFFDFPRFRLIAASTSLSHAEALEAVVQKGVAEGAFGEGLADALGSDGF